MFQGTGSLLGEGTFRGGGSLDGEGSFTGLGNCSAIALDIAPPPEAQAIADTIDEVSPCNGVKVITDFTAFRSDIAIHHFLRGCNQADKKDLGFA